MRPPCEPHSKPRGLQLPAREPFDLLLRLLREDAPDILSERVFRIDERVREYRDAEDFSRLIRADAARDGL